MADDDAEFADFVARREIVRDAQMKWTKNQELKPMGIKTFTVFDEKKKQKKERSMDRSDYEDAKRHKNRIYGEEVLRIAKKVRTDYDEWAAIKHKCERDPVFHKFLHGQYKYQTKLSQAWSGFGSTGINTLRGSEVQHQMKLDNSTQDELAEMYQNGIMCSGRLSSGHMQLPSKLPLSKDETNFTAEPWWWKLIPSLDGNEVPWVPGEVKVKEEPMDKTPEAPTTEKLSREEEDDLDKLLKTMSASELNLLEKAACVKTNNKHAKLRAERSKCAQQ